MKKIAVINGPNMDMLGLREADIYGRQTLEEVNAFIALEAEKLGAEVTFFQSNIEGELINAIHNSSNADGVILNAAAYTHTSVALRDAIAAIETPVIEVHLSNIFAREEFRHKSYIAAVVKGSISGFGKRSYTLALRALCGEEQL